MSAVSAALRWVCVLALLGLSGCATVSKNECLAGDWYGIGVRDGADGYGEERFVENAEACSKHGIAADRERWLDGRMRGLERYCTVRNGLAVGERNSTYRGVCSPPDEEGFLRGYELGRDLGDARGRLSSLESEIQNIRDRLDRDRRAGEHPNDDNKKHRLSDREREDLAYRLGVAVGRREEAVRDVHFLEDKARDL